MGGLEAGWEAGGKHNELSANSVLNNKVNWDSASHKMLILCFEKQILFLIWDILKCQFLKVTEFSEKLCLKADWGAEMLTWVLHFFLPHNWPCGRWGPGPSLSAGCSRGEAPHIQPAQEHLQGPIPWHLLHPPFGSTEDGGATWQKEGRTQNDRVGQNSPPQPITHLTWARNAVECVKLLAFQADCSAVSLLCYRVAPLLTWSIYSALFSDPPALLSLKNYFLFSPGNCPAKYVIHVSSPYSAAWGAGKAHTRCQPRKSPTQGGRRHTGTQEELLKIKLRVVPIFHLQFQRAALWFHQVNTTEVLSCPRACLHVGNALTFVLGLTADKVHF